MESDNNLSSLSSHLGVKVSVLKRLIHELGSRSNFESFVLGKNNESFWRAIDMMPIGISMELHRLQFETNTTSKDFSSDFLTPSIQDFFITSNQCQGLSSECYASSGFHKINQSMVAEFLLTINGWRKENESFVFQKYVFPINSLTNMCESYLRGGNPWVHIPISSICSAYNEIDMFLQKNFVENVDHIYHKLKSFQYLNVNEFRNDFEKLSTRFSFPRITPFEMPKDLSNALNQLMCKSFDFFTQISLMTSLKANDWSQARLPSLLEQSSLHSSDQKDICLTSNVIESRFGNSGSGDSPFDTTSLFELLFSGPQGEAAPLPFHSAKTEIVGSLPVSYPKDATRRFLSLMLIDQGYTETTEFAIESLNDVLFNELKRIGSVSATIKDSGVSSKNCVTQALRNIGYDIHTLKEYIK